jgi:hypothetical protein
VVVLLCSLLAMAQVVDARPMGFWDLWCPSMVEAVAEKGDFAVEVVDVVGEGFDCAMVVAVIEMVG